jgi:hypothetical protein
MGTYDGIAAPISGQPMSVGMYGIPMRDAVRDLDVRVALLEAAQILPIAVRGSASGTNTLTPAINVWTNLPTNTWGTVQMTNPSTEFDLMCLVSFGAWMNNTAGSLRFGVLLTGGVSAGPDPSTNSVAGFGMMPLEGANSQSVQHAGSFSLIIPAGAAAVTFTGQGQRSVASGTQNINYPTIEVTPIRFQPA